MPVLLAISDIQEHLSNFESEDRSLLELLESNAVSDVVRRSGRTLEEDSAAVARVLDGTGTNRLVVPTPITSGSVTVRERGDVSGDWESVASGDVETRWMRDLQTHELLRSGAVWPLGRGTIEATYKSGWPVGSVDLPGWLRDALLHWIGSKYATRVQNAGAFEEDSEGIGGGELPPDVADMFQRHLAIMRREGPPHRLWRG